MSSNTDLKHLAGLVHPALDRFGIRLKSPVVVGLSGGKDSTTLCLILRELGFEVLPAIVEMGYKDFDAKGTQAQSRRLGFSATILDVADPRDTGTLKDAQKAKVKSSLRILNSPEVTMPCGACSTVKRALLTNFAERTGAFWIGLGHHKTDFITTLLKDYFVDCYYHALGEYDAIKFDRFVRGEALDLGILAKMIQTKKASTMGMVAGAGPRARFVRPMAGILESQIAAYVKSAGIATFGSGCSHGYFTNFGPSRMSKREIVHKWASEFLSTRTDLVEPLSHLAYSSLGKSGFIRFSPRGTRDKRCPGFINQARGFSELKICST